MLWTESQNGTAAYLTQAAPVIFLLFGLFPAWNGYSTPANEPDFRTAPSARRKSQVFQNRRGFLLNTKLHRPALNYGDESEMNFARRA